MRMPPSVLFQRLGLSSIKKIISVFLLNLKAFNNKSHDSVGGQDTSAPNLSLKDIAIKLGYDICKIAKSEKQIKKILKNQIKNKKNLFLEISCSRGNRKNLTRPGKSLKIYNEFITNKNIQPNSIIDLRIPNRLIITNE